MKYVVLGKTNLKVNKNGFGALPIQRVSADEAINILRAAKDGGINYFDTARAYSDSEEKLGLAFGGQKRSDIIISTKTGALNKEDMRKDLENSLRNLRTDYIDIYQFHNPAFCPVPGDSSGLYDEALKAQREGKIRHIGITNHRLNVANEAIDSGLYETLQYPFSYLSGDKELDIVTKAGNSAMGVIAMKALSGGLITDSAAAYAFMLKYDYVEPIWGIQRLSELSEFLSYQDNEPVMTQDILKKIVDDKTELNGDFCRGCGYCLETCPTHIQINTCARMSLLLRRSPKDSWLTEYWQEEMKKIDSCLDCGVCKTKCPYGLDTPKLLKKNYEDYKTFL